MFNLRQALRLCLVIGPSNVKGDWLAVVRQALDGGVTMVQLREKQAKPAELLAHAYALQAILPSTVPLIINDCIETAMRLGVGLHIGQQDCPYPKARRLLGGDACIGLSIENERQAQRDKCCGANYFGIGPVYASPSKVDAAPSLGVAQACEIARIVQPAPCVFIGGLNQENVVRLRAFGGLAVISAVAASAHPKQAAQRLLGVFA